MHTSEPLTAEEEKELLDTRNALEDEMLETQKMLRELQAQQDAQMEELGEMRKFMSEELQNLKSDAWKYETYAELERCKQLFMTGQSLSALSRGGSLVDGSLVDGSLAEAPPAASLTPSGSGSSEEDAPFALTRTMSTKEATDPLMDELNAEMASISAQLKVAQADRDDMEAKKNALQHDIAMFTEQCMHECPGLVEPSLEQR
eukprot:CAMPEP_0118921046 /NCGR_PEP_ID=MMETSP1169-20130426/440_1 /TAXON_ID=36882 /ORGANISM="Pyramimonas obovata, Strain CCMP722" /LENGTH=202 /DNA_ID=CAMNT_0006861697 /DNA_START=428 /DNA_END=1036 /DNA_ORIENTATION=+